ncbi:uncharacterized protein J7T54_008250 [Emericellopsis cladophorae]|uniref:MARVEL domain-containing protein n=1 Tax=Emericellopsis cladophorae TaxID=2686198 RepID=A0A9Q0BBS9_9HYPO|nr:uncharacterized protein J7T54_008250 [Emericellopsis cladophorae]KAI6779632.1 hypothetical protein J7T54_008250 [Emericellopsis cladophorae]
MDPTQQPQQAQFSQYQQQQQQYQHQPATNAVKPPPPHVSPRNMWLSKVIFRILSAIFSIVIIGLSAYVGTKWSDGYGGYYGGSPLVIMLPPACVGLIWDLGEMVAVLVRGGHRGTHPGAVVALDLVLWLGFIVAVVFYALYYMGDIYYYGSYWYEYESLSEIGETIIMSRVILALGSIEVAIHLLLFIFGCYETSIRNRRTPPVVYIPGPMGYGMPPTSQQPQHFSQYGAHAPGQPIMLPVGQAPPAGYVAYSYAPQDGRASKQYDASTVSPLPQEPSPIHTTSTPAHGGWRDSYQPAQTSGQPNVSA